MKIIGTLVLAIGLIFIFITLSVDPYGSSGYLNIARMNEKQNFLIVSVAVAMAGVVIVAFGYHSEQTTLIPNKTSLVSTKQETRVCPFCAERIMAQAKVCRYCGRDINPVVESSNEGIEELGITFDGEHYFVREFRFTEVEDAIARAKQLAVQDGVV